MDFSGLNHKDVWIRSAKTFAASFVGVFIVSISDLLNAFHSGGGQATKALGISLVASAIGAGVTAVWNYLLQAKSNASA